MPPRRSFLPDLALEEAKAYCRRYRLRVADARKVVQLLNDVKRLSLLVVEPDGSVPTMRSTHSRKPWWSEEDLDYEPAWGLDGLLFEGSLSPAASARNDIARHMHALLDPDGDRLFWHGPVLIQLHSRTSSGFDLPETPGFAVLQHLQTTHRRATEMAAAEANTPAL